MKYQIVESIINLLIKDDPYNSDPHEWSEGEHRYFLTAHALRWLPEPTRFVNETDYDIASRLWNDYFIECGYGNLKDLQFSMTFSAWLDKENK